MNTITNEEMENEMKFKASRPTMNTINEEKKLIPDEMGDSSRKSPFELLQEEVERLRKENEEQKEVIAWADEELSRLKSGKESQLLDELATLKKQVEGMRTEREFELAYCFGLMASDGITIDRMAEATTSERWSKIKDEIKKLK